jgi:Fe-Mn family superoxide dismutase
MIHRASQTGEHVLPPLPYAYDALEPHVSEATLRQHHDKHHKAYVDGLNKAERALEGAREDGDYEAVPALNAALQFNAGGHFLHTLYWPSLVPAAEYTGPSEELVGAIEADFGSWSAFREQMKESTVKVRGSGWGVLVLTPSGLRVVTVMNHENGVLWDGVALLPIDAWEHAYYLDYQSDRAAHFDAVFDHLVNWPEVERRLGAVLVRQRVARGKSKKDVGHGGLDEWFSGHGEGEGKAPWGDWVAISPVKKKVKQELADGTVKEKTVKPGDIVGPCGVSDDPNWKSVTRDGKDPLKCMPRQKAHDTPKSERAELARGKLRAERGEGDRGKEPTRTRTFEKEASDNEPTNPKLWEKAKAKARKRYTKWPSAYAVGHALKLYKDEGGGWKKKAGSPADLDAYLEGFFQRHPRLAPYRRKLRFRAREQGGSTGHGEARQHGDEVWLFPKFWTHDKGVQDFILAHEVGHWVKSDLGGQEFIALANGLGLDPWDSSSLPFAQVNMDEAFADAFASYYTDGDVKRRYPEWAKLVEAVNMTRRVASRYAGRVYGNPKE